MVVGFTITAFNGYEDLAVEYIRKVCVLDNQEIAHNIVAAGPGVNIFSDNIVLSELLEQPFSTVPIEVNEGEYILVSTVNFNLELLYNNNTLKLAPTEYVYVEPEEVSQFNDYIRQGFVRLIPTYIDGKEWILTNGSWNDEGIWVDSNYWRDLNE